MHALTRLRGFTNKTYYRNNIDNYTALKTSFNKKKTNSPRLSFYTEIAYYRICKKKCICMYNFNCAKYTRNSYLLFITNVFKPEKISVNLKSQAHRETKNEKLRTRLTKALAHSLPTKVNLVTHKSLSLSQQTRNSDGDGDEDEKYTTRVQKKNAKKKSNRAAPRAFHVITVRSRGLITRVRTRPGV